MAAPRAHDALLATIPRLVACQRAAATGRVLDLAGADLSRCAAGEYDTVVSHLTLCTVDDLDASVAELHRVVGPDGQLLFIEHVLARTPVALLQRAMAPTWARITGGCHVERDVIGVLRRGGFVITDCERPTPWGRLSAGSLVAGRAITRRGT